MQISNPIASQYVVNQGLASQLNTQNNQLPVKSERFSVDNKIPAPTEDEQRLRSEADKKNKQTPATLEANQENFPQLNKELNNNANSLAKKSTGLQQQANAQSYTEFSEQKKQLPAPIQSYLETSSLGSDSRQLSRIDFFI